MFPSSSLDPSSFISPFSSISVSFSGGGSVFSIDCSPLKHPANMIGIHIIITHNNALRLSMLYPSSDGCQYYIYELGQEIRPTFQNLSIKKEPFPNEEPFYIMLFGVISMCIHFSM